MTTTKNIHGFVKFEIARRVLGQRHALVDLKDLPAYDDKPGYYASEAEKEAYFQEYVSYARRIRQLYLDALGRYSEISDHAWIKTQIPEVELVHGSVSWQHNPLNAAAERKSFRDGKFRLTAYAGGMDIQIESGSPFLKSALAVDAALLVLLNHAPYRSGGDPRGMAMVELLRHAPREMVETMVVDYGNQHDIHIKAFG